MDTEDKYVLIFKDSDLAISYLKSGHSHVYCLTDEPNPPKPTQIKYYPYSLNTHFPDNMFDLIINKGIGENLEEVGKFLLECNRIGKNDAEIIAPLSENFEWPKIKGKQEPRKLQKVNIVCNSLGVREGTSEYAISLAQRFEGEGVTVNLVRRLAYIDKKFPTIFEYDPGIIKELPEDPNTIIEAHVTAHPNLLFEEIAYRAKLALETKSPRFMFKEAIRLLKLATQHSELIRNAMRRSDPKANEKLQKCRLLMRNPYIAEKSAIGNYTLMPLIAYPKLNFERKKKSKGIRLGSMGYALESKNFDRICDLAIHLKVPLTLMISINEVTPKMKEMQEQYAKEIYEKYSKHPSITIYIGYFAPEEILHELSDCTHLIYSQNEARGASYSMRFGMQLGIPVISHNVFQARDAQAYTVKSLNDITLEYLRDTKEPIVGDDGFVYLEKVLGMV